MNNYKQYLNMGSICPCLIPKNKPQVPYSYDAHETFEMSENLSDLVSTNTKGFQMLNEEAANDDHEPHFAKSSVNFKEDTEHTLS